MKIKLTYKQVKEALASGFVSPLNNMSKGKVLNLARSINSFIDAAKPRAAAKHVTDLINKSGLLGVVKAPATKAKLNIFIRDTVIDLHRLHRANNAI